MALQEDKKIITQFYFTAINASNLELFKLIKPKFEEVQPIYPLIEFIIERLGTVTTLTMDNRLWDAEIVLRSALETFIKFVFITSADPQEQKIRLHEYWNFLEEINLIKQSEQAKKNLIHLGEQEIYKLAYTPLVLSDEKEKNLRTKWTKTERQKLEQKWSFTQMINSLTKNYRGKPMEMFAVLTHTYRMCSHVSHGDETGIQIIKERNSRTQKEQEIANFSHYLRLLSDSFQYCSFVGIETMFYLNLIKEIEFFTKLIKNLKDIEDLRDKYQKEGFQDKDYDKYRT